SPCQNQKKRWEEPQPMRGSLIGAAIVLLTAVPSLAEEEQLPPATGARHGAEAATSAGAPPVCKGGTANLTKDRFTGDVTLQTEMPKRSLFSSNYEPTPLLTAIGGQIRLAFLVVGKSWRYLNCYSVALLADGEKVTTEEPERQGHI